MKPAQSSQAPLRFSTKAENLAQLHGLIDARLLLPQWTLSHAEWQGIKHNRAAWTARIHPFGSQLIVRSSAADEDQTAGTRAGHYTSLTLESSAQLPEAIEAVFARYPKRDPRSCVLIQPWIKHPRINGVVFSCEPASGRPYVVINYDEASGTHDDITSGRSRNPRTLYLARSHLQLRGHGWQQSLIAVLLRLETLFACQQLDLEFLLTQSNDLHVVQVRPLPLPSATTATVAEQRDCIDALQMRHRSAASQHPQAPTLWGNMPDWNPAEMIGTRPNALALSLYRHLITDRSWAESRQAYGYCAPADTRLMLELAGQGHIDVRKSLTSLTPADIPDALRESLVQQGLQRLADNPHWHDRIEFTVSHNCDHFSVAAEREQLAQAGFSPAQLDDLFTALRRLTRRVIFDSDSPWRQDWQTISQLPNRLHNCAAKHAHLAARFEALLEVTRRCGARPFAGLARAGFMARRLLDSMQREGVLSASDSARFMAGLPNDTAQLCRDFAQLSRDEFLHRYGHMRPDMYNLCSPRYDARPELYFNWKKPHTARSKPPMVWTKSQLDRLQTLMQQQQWPGSPEALIQFIQAAIFRREHGKVLYARGISALLDCCLEIGRTQGVSAVQLAHLTLSEIHALARGEHPAEAVIQARAKQRAIHHSLLLPPLIRSADELACFATFTAAPSYITDRCITAPTARLSSDQTQDLSGRIVLMQRADPGCDWIFTHGIAGLVTQYGGCNSHMAIRASELELPAIIGAGTALYRRCAAARVLSLDCLNKTTRAIT